MRLEHHHHIFLDRRLAQLPEDTQCLCSRLALAPLAQVQLEHLPEFKLAIQTGQ